VRSSGDEPAVLDALFEEEAEVVTEQLAQFRILLDAQLVTEALSVSDRQCITVVSGRRTTSGSWSTRSIRPVWERMIMAGVPPAPRSTVRAGVAELPRFPARRC
jgi:hypothetical protein